MWRRCSPKEAWTSPTVRSAVLRTVRRWFLKFGSVIAANLRRTRPRPSDHWHLDEMVVVIQQKRYWLWRAVYNEGEVLDFLVQSRRGAKAARKLMRKLLKKHGFAPSRVVTDKLRSYSSASRVIGLKSGGAVSLMRTSLHTARRQGYQAANWPL